MSVEEKKKREEKLLETYKSLPFGDGKTEWVSSVQYTAFANCWAELRDVYAIYDTFIEFNVEIIRIYRNVTSYLRKILVEPDIEEVAKSQFAEALEEIEYWMDELIREAQRNLTFLEDMDGQV